MTGAEGQHILSITILSITKGPYRGAGTGLLLLAPANLRATGIPRNHRRERHATIGFRWGSLDIITCVLEMVVGPRLVVPVGRVLKGLAGGGLVAGL